MESKYEFEKKYREQILKCSRCGFCQAVCPVYGATLRPALNARGKMLLLKEVMDGKVELNDELIETLFQCTTCANCFENCPSGVEVPEIIKEARKDMVRVGSCHPAFEGMNEVLKKHTNIYAEGEPEDFERERNKQAEEVGADIVLTECNSCAHNLGNAKLRKQKFKIYNTTEFINELMEEAE